MITKRSVAKLLIKEFFKDDYNKPFKASDGQADVFNAVFLKEKPRVEVIASTQYGKSTILAMAILLRTQVFGEQFSVLAGSEAKAKIIMEKIIQHLFDDVRLYSQLEIDRAEPLERLKRERSKDRLTWKCGGEVRIYSAKTKSKKNITDALTGFGSPNIVEDEAGLIPDDFQAMVMRMLGGHAINFLCKVGNPFERNHFYRTWNDDRYEKILIDYKQALREGRYTDEFIDEVRNEKFFDVLYECKFPDDSEFDLSGYIRLLSDAEIINAKRAEKDKGELRLGFDVGEGGDENVGVVRSDKYARVVHISKIKDLMATTKIIVDLMKDYKIKAENVFVDATGIGAGVVARLKELDKDVVGIKWGAKALSGDYKNLKAENFFNGREWIKNGGALEPKDVWNELSLIRFKTDTMGKIAIKTKEELRKEGVKSPNIADAWALTYNRSIEEYAPKIHTI